ncbi:MAG: recombinase family protein [Opitutae bacterium]|nr:recombinase family protein [Opitutae bacterium]
MVGYAGVSHQSLEAQTDALTAAGCERIFSDKLSGALADRPGLARLLDYVRPGDTVVVLALDRLGWSLSGVIRTVETLTNPEVLLRGRHTGRRPRLTAGQACQVRSLRAGRESLTDLTRSFGARATVYCAPNAPDLTDTPARETAPTTGMPR